MDLVSIIAASAAPLTIIGTTVVTIVNRHYDMKQKQIDLYEARRLDAINNFADAFAKLHGASSNLDSAIRGALAATFAVIPYAEPSVRKELNDLSSLLHSRVEIDWIYDSFEQCLNLISASTAETGKPRGRSRLRKHKHQ